MDYKEEIVAQVMNKAGITKAQAQTAVDQVLAFVKERLPAPWDENLEGLLDGKVDQQDLIKGLSGLGSFFGKK